VTAVVPRHKGDERLASGLKLGDLIAGPVLPTETSVPDAPWLAPDQRMTVWRLVALVRWHGGAMIANPIDSGKTFLALAAGRELAVGGPITYSCRSGSSSRPGPCLTASAGIRTIHLKHATVHLQRAQSYI